MRKPRHPFRAGVLALMALGVSCVGYHFSTAASRVAALCVQIKPGMPLAALQAFAQRHGLGPGSPREGIQYLVELKSFGRHGCRVTVKSGLVRESAYTHAD